MESREGTTGRRINYDDQSFECWAMGLGCSDLSLGMGGGGGGGGHILHSPHYTPPTPLGLIADVPVIVIYLKATIISVYLFLASLRFN